MQGFRGIRSTFEAKVIGKFYYLKDKLHTWSFFRSVESLRRIIKDIDFAMMAEREVIFRLMRENSGLPSVGSYDFKTDAEFLEYLARAEAAFAGQYVINRERLLPLLSTHDLLLLGLQPYWRANREEVANVDEYVDRLLSTRTPLLPLLSS